MPVYEYECARCGPFAALRALGERNAPQRCPTCDELAVRGIFTAPALGTLSVEARTAHVVNERSAHEPRRVSVRADAGRRSEAGSSGLRAAHGRPWMVGH